jgi:hypothetical protein
MENLAKIEVDWGESFRVQVHYPGYYPFEDAEGAWE